MQFCHFRAEKRFNSRYHNCILFKEMYLIPDGVWVPSPSFGFFIKDFPKAFQRVFKIFPKTLKRDIKEKR